MTVVPALGLTLEEVGYPVDDELAARATQPGEAGAPVTAPPAHVLTAFGATGAPVPAARGMGCTWIAGDVVLKEVDDEAEHGWVCDVYDAWSSDDVAVARPIAVDGRWSLDGWGAQALLPGETACAGDDPGWFRMVHEAFHDVTRDLARPAFLDTRDAPWTYGERVAWEGESPRVTRRRCRC